MAFMERKRIHRFGFGDAGDAGAESGEGSGDGSGGGGSDSGGSEASGGGGYSDSGGAVGGGGEGFDASAGGFDAPGAPSSVETGWGESFTPSAEQLEGLDTFTVRDDSVAMFVVDEALPASSKPGWAASVIGSLVDKGLSFVGGILGGPLGVMGTGGIQAITSATGLTSVGYQTAVGLQSVANVVSSVWDSFQSSKTGSQTTPSQSRDMVSSVSYNLDATMEQIEAKSNIRDAIYSGDAYGAEQASNQEYSAISRGAALPVDMPITDDLISAYNEYISSRQELDAMIESGPTPMQAGMSLPIMLLVGGVALSFLLGGKSIKGRQKRRRRG